MMISRLLSLQLKFSLMLSCYYHTQDMTWYASISQTTVFLRAHMKHTVQMHQSLLSSSVLQYESMWIIIQRMWQVLFEVEFVELSRVEHLRPRKNKVIGTQCH